MPTTANEAFAAVGLGPDRICQVRWGTNPTIAAPGVYLVSLTAHLDSTTVNSLKEAPLAKAQFDRWLEKCPKLTLDGERPTVPSLMRSIGRFWIPDEVILYIGRATRLSGRLRSFYETPIGARRPHSGGYFLKLLSNLDQLWVHYAECVDPPSVEYEMLSGFCQKVSAESRRALRDPDHPLPFANLEWPPGVRKKHGLRSARD
jgi:hypothetical protein